MDLEVKSQSQLVASMSDHWERYRTSTICITVRWKLTMTISLYLCSYWTESSPASKITSHLPETELSGSKKHLGLQYADMPKISINVISYP